MGPTRDFVKSRKCGFRGVGLPLCDESTGPIAGNKRASEGGVKFSMGNFDPFGVGFLKCPGVTLESPQVTSDYVGFTCGSELDDFRG